MWYRHRLESQKRVSKILESAESSSFSHLTEAYQKARRNLTLASAILLAWEYVGVQVGTSAAKFPISEIPFNLLNPEVLPHIITLIIIFFYTRLGIEWFQCDYGRRRTLPCKLDFSLASLLAFLAIGLFLFQKLSGIRVASYSEIMDGIGLGVVGTIGTLLTIWTFCVSKESCSVLISNEKKRSAIIDLIKTIPLFTMNVLFLIAMYQIFSLKDLSYIYMLLGVIFGIAFFFLAKVTVRRLLPE